MTDPPVLNIYLDPPMLQTVRAGKLKFINLLRQLLEQRGWQTAVHPSGAAARKQAPHRAGYALFHMEKPTHPAALTFRLAYHYPFWRLEPMAERWRWPVAQALFDPARIDPVLAQDFARRLRQRVLSGPDPQSGQHVLIALQGRIRKQRSFQTASPVAMVAAVTRTGRPCVVTLHPNADYDAADMAALDRLAARHANLTIGGDTMRLLRDCAFVVTQNSAVALDGFILGKPAVLFAQVDFHHIALNVADLGVDEALARAPGHRPDFAAYLDWFLRQNSIDMMAQDARQRLLATMKRGGWPV